MSALQQREDEQDKEEVASRSKVGFQMQLGGKRPRSEATRPVHGLGFEQEEAKEETDYVTEVAGTSIKSSVQREEKAPLVIPLLKVNQWRGRSTSPTAPNAVAAPEDGHAAAPLQSTNDISSEKAETAPVPKTLEERAIEALKHDAERMEQGDDGSAIAAIPLLLQNRVPGYDDAKDDKERYLADVNLRPDEADIEAYEAVPVEAFGAAALRGMGWKEGEAIGSTNKGLAAPIVGIPRLPRLGLGAKRDTELQPDRKRPPKKYVKPGESRDQTKQMVLAPGPDGKTKHMRGLDEELVEIEVPTMCEGAYVVLGAGPHRGMCGKVRRVRSDRIEIELALGSEIVHSREEDLRLLTRVEYKIMRSSGRQPDKREGSSSSSSGGGGGSSSSGSNKRRREEPSWLERNTRVRIVSESFKGGRYYNKKVRGAILEGVHQNDLETVIPKSVGATVVVVLGKHKGQRGKLLEKSSKSGGTAVVQLMGESDIATYKYDEVCEYVGEDEDNFF